MKKLVAYALKSFGYSVVKKDAIPDDFDADVKNIIGQVRPFTMTSPERLNALCHAAKYISTNGIEGDIVECGVWRGGSMLAVARVLDTMDDWSRTLWMYDTFEGMSKPTEHDLDIAGISALDLLRKEKKSADSDIWCYASLQDVQQNMKRSAYPFERIRFIQGKVEETLNKTVPERIALLRLDTDWYESTRAEMEVLFPRLTRGGVLIIDDYGHWQGARKAIDEYLASRNIAILLNRIDYTGRIAVKAF
jgi:hypothetical protein